MTQAPKSLASALALALGQMADKRFRAIVFRALLLAAAVLTGLSALAIWGASQSGELWGIDTGWLAGIGAFLVSVTAAFVLIMPLAAFIMGLFLESVAEAVEARHYPQDSPGKEAGLGASLGVSLRFMGKLLVLNTLALVAYLIPGVNIIVFLLLNGYLAGREFFEMVALRHHKPRRVRALRKKYRLKLLLTGVIIACLLAVPGINFVAPLFGVALMVHVYKDIEARAAVSERELQPGTAVQVG